MAELASLSLSSDPDQPGEAAPPCHLCDTSLCQKEIKLF